jgi:hypothetical protein
MVSTFVLSSHLLPSAQDRIIKGLPLRPVDYSSKDERKAEKIFTPGT